MRYESGCPYAPVRWSAPKDGAEAHSDDSACGGHWNRTVPGQWEGYVHSSRGELTNSAIAHGGPAGAFLAYCTVGSVIWSVRESLRLGFGVKLTCAVVSLGEMAVYAPISGSFIHYAERWLHPSAGFALGWLVVFQYVMSLPGEIIAACILVSFWDTSELAADVVYLILIRLDFTIQREAGYIILFSGFCIVIVSYTLPADMC